MKTVKKLLILLIVSAILPYAIADITIDYSIKEANWAALSTPYNFSVDVGIDNTANNPVVVETPYAKFIIWVEKVDSKYYAVYTKSITTNGYLSIYYMAELFNANGKHPADITNNPTYAWGDSNGIIWYWWGVSESDFKDSIDNISNYWIYYGSDCIDELSKYDPVIIEPYNYNKEDIERLKALNPNIKVIAYLSVGEVNPSRPYFDECQDIIIGKNPYWDSYYVNVSSPLWEGIMINETKKFLSMGFDGVFLDTIDSAIYNNQSNGVTELIKKLREVYPTIIIIQNRGFDMVDKTAPYIDGVLFEDFSTYYDFEENTAKYWEGNDLEWINTQAEKLKQLNITVLTLDYVNDEEMAKYCIERTKEYGFIPMVTEDIYLNSVE